MSSLKKTLEEKPGLAWIIFLGAMAVVFILGLFAASIMERRSEALVSYKPAKEIKELDPRNEVWGRNFPKEYSSFLKMEEGDFESKYNGNKLRDALEEDPRLVVLWAGYGFSKDYNQPRGHFYAIDDIRKTLRTGAPTGPDDGPMPSTCWTCKSPDVPRLMKEIGVKEFYQGKWAGKGAEIVNPIGCADCHDEKTMDLKITRPALVEAFQRQGKDITKATPQEKRSLVCAQCHVEYYFKGKDKYLTFPWDKGMSAEKMEEYYDEIEFKDWTHKLSRAPMLKAQHPGYEVWKTGIHARRGVTCADCHMPYKSEGGVKFSDHHIQSPLNNINASCQTCHRESEEEIRKTVYDKQDKVAELKTLVEKSLVRAHIEAKAAWDNGATEAEMKEVLKNIRHAQWRWDYAVASHGAAFHAALEMNRVLGTAIQKAAEARRLLVKVLAKHGVDEVPMPDISTKEKAQHYIGLNVKKLKSDKEKFLKTLVPKWDAEAAQRHKDMDK